MTDLRDGEHPDDDNQHARGNAEQLAIAEAELEEGDGDE